MRISVAVMMLVMTPLLSASPVDCLARIIYAESRGESLETLAITARAAYNRAIDSRRICSIIYTGEVKAVKQIPSTLRPYFESIASTAINNKSDISKGADSWNTGKHPAFIGEIKRISGKHVYYRMKK